MMKKYIILLCTLYCVRNVFAESKVVFTDIHPVTNNLCSGSNSRITPHVGDFNGDGNDDFICHDKTSGNNVIYYAPRKPFELHSSNLVKNWCTGGSDGQVFVGDFNGDGRSDYLCHNINNGHKFIAYAEADGRIKGTNWNKAMKWCTGNAELHIGDFNGDGRTDLLCDEPANGRKHIAYSNIYGNFGNTNWHKIIPKCNGKLFTGDFNGDKKTDILCVENSKMYITLAGPSDNVFNGHDWTGDSTWCCQSADSLRVGDINGDGYDDLIYKEKSTEGRIRYLLNTGGYPIFDGKSHKDRFCPSGKPENFHLADVNGDGKKDLLCVNGGVEVAITSLK